MHCKALTTSTRPRDNHCAEEKAQHRGGDNDGDERRLSNTHHLVVELALDDIRTC